LAEDGSLSEQAGGELQLERLDLLPDVVDLFPVRAEGSEPPAQDLHLLEVPLDVAPAGQLELLPLAVRQLDDPVDVVDLELQLALELRPDRLRGLPVPEDPGLEGPLRDFEALDPRRLSLLLIVGVLALSGNQGPGKKSGQHESLRHSRGPHCFSAGFFAGASSFAFGSSAAGSASTASSGAGWKNPKPPQ